MYVRSVLLTDVRGFRWVDLRLDREGASLAGWTVVAGRNGTGKTTLLRAIALAVVGRTLAPWLQEDVADWVRAGSGEAHMSLALAPQPEDSFGGQGRRPKGLVVSLQWRGDYDLLFASAFSEVAGDRLRTSDRPALWADNATGWFLAGYGPFRRLSGHATEAQGVMRGPPRVARLATLFREDASLLEALEWLRDLHLRALENRPGAEALKALVLDLLNDGLLPDPDLRVLRYDADGLWVQRTGDEPLRLGGLSDGYRSVAALVLDLFRALHDAFGPGAITRNQDSPRVVVRAPGVVLIDEVDAHLHVSWQRRIGPWLKAHFPAIQFIVTSHSPFICQSADPGGLVLLPPPGSDAKVRVADDALYNRVVNGSVDDALLSELFGLDHTWSDAAEERRARLAALDARLLEGEATGDERQERKALLAVIPQTMSDEVDRAASRVLGDRPRSGSQ